MQGQEPLATPGASAGAERNASAAGAPPEPSGGPVAEPVREGFFRGPGGPRAPTSLPPPELRVFARDPWTLFALWSVHPRLRPGRYRPDAEVQLQVVLLDREGTRLAAENVMLTGGHYFTGLTAGETYLVELWWQADGEVPEPLPLPPREVELPPDRPAAAAEVQLLRLPWDVPLGEAAALLRGTPAETAGEGEATRGPEAREAVPGERVVPPGTFGPWGLPGSATSAGLPGSATSAGMPGAALSMGLPGSATLTGLPGSATLTRPGVPPGVTTRQVTGATLRLPSSAERPLPGHLPSSAEVRTAPWRPAAAALPSSHVGALSSADLRPAPSLRTVPPAPAVPVPGALPGSAEAVRVTGAPGLPASEAARRGAWHPLPGSGDLPRAGVGGPGPAEKGAAGLSSHAALPGGPSSAELPRRAPPVWVTWVAPSTAAPPPLVVPGQPASSSPASAVLAPAVGAPASAPAPVEPPRAVPSVIEGRIAGQLAGPPSAPGPAPEGGARPGHITSDFFGRWRPTPIARGPSGRGRGSGNDGERE